MIWNTHINCNSGFTFVEIIVVITIIALLSVNSVFYFNDFIWKQELSYDISQLESNIIDLDADIKNQKSFDYSLYFNKNSYWYSISQNSIWNNIKQNVIFDTITWIAKINLIPSSIEIWEIVIYKWHKKIQQLTRNWSEDLDIQIEDTIHVLWSLSGSTLNKLTLQYFDLDKESELKNTYILDIIDSNDTSYDSLKIENISGNKKYLSGSQLMTPPIEIFFEKNWIESILELN